MTSASELIDGWNKIFSFKLTEDDLKKPTESYVCSAFESYLPTINIGLCKLHELKTHRDNHKYKLQLCHCINYFYKIQCNDNNFYYIDLLRPMPKKTIHVLTMLLNYFHYHTMLKIDVVDKANTLINDHQNIVKSKNQFLVDNEKVKIFAENNYHKLNNMENITIPELKQQIDNFNIDNKRLIDEVASVQVEINKIETNNINLTRKEVELSAQIVSEKEYHHLTDSLKTVEAAILELDEVEKANIFNSQEQYHNINKMDEINKKLESIFKICTVSDLTATIGLETNLVELNEELNKSNTRNKLLIANINMLKAENEHLTELIRQNQKMSTDADEKSFAQLKLEEQNLIKQNEIISTDLFHINKKIMELEMIQDFIISNGVQVLEKISEKK